MVLFQKNEVITENLPYDQGVFHDSKVYKDGKLIHDFDNKELAKELNL